MTDNRTALAERLDELAEDHERCSRDADTDFWRDAMASEAAVLREAARGLDGMYDPWIGPVPARTQGDGA